MTMCHRKFVTKNLKLPCGTENLKWPCATRNLKWPCATENLRWPRATENLRWLCATGNLSMTFCYQKFKMTVCHRKFEMTLWHRKFEMTMCHRKFEMTVCHIHFSPISNEPGSRIFKKISQKSGDPFFFIFHDPAVMKNHKNQALCFSSIFMTPRSWRFKKIRRKPSNLIFGQSP